ncbi:MAG: glycosyltransferase family 39 protein, partial [Candidatus Gastranaerophilales bacterium]|nr:glycosyltransferase family 39 protein [Candidatus Gastranaerophilales bacterium]
MNYIKRNYGIISAGILFIVCFLLYFLNIANYPFIDTDETKFVSIAKDMLNCSDWINIKLNGEILYEYNPLYFWITNLSCFIMGKISPESVRLPVSLFSLAGILFVYFSISKILTKTYAFIISIILAASFGTIIFSRLATNDMLFCTLTMIDILFAYLILLQNNEKNKQMLWIFVYFFMALSVLCSGLFGILIPLTAIIGINIFSGNLKEIFKPKNLIPGVILFIIITFPWYL